MKKYSAIREMFDGNRGTYELVKHSETYKKSEKKMFDAMESFLEKLAEKEKAQFEEVFEKIAINNFEYAADHFVDGFKLGLLMGLEVTED